METLSIKDCRNRMAASYDKAANAENVLIRRKNEIYALVKVGHEDLLLTKDLQKRIDDVHQAYQQGKCITCSTLDELDSLLNAL